MASEKLIGLEPGIANLGAYVSIESPSQSDVMLFRFAGDAPADEGKWRLGDKRKRVRVCADVHCSVNRCAGHVCIKPMRIVATCHADQSKSQWLVVMVKARFALLDLNDSARAVETMLFPTPFLPWRVGWTVTCEQAKPESPWTFTFAPSLTVLGSGGSPGGLAYHRPKQVALPAGSVIVAREVSEPDWQAGVDMQGGRLCVRRDREVQFAPGVEWGTLDSHKLQGLEDGEQSAYGHGCHSAISYRVRNVGQSNLGLLVAVEVWAYQVKASKKIEVNSVPTEPVLRQRGAVKLL
jgi:hypothetical protein